MPKVVLTDAFLRALSPAAMRRDYGDAHVRGLSVRHETSGELIFQVRKRAGGKKVRHTLGRYPGLSLKAARAEAIQALALLNAGRDPTAERRAAQAEAVAGRAEPETVAARLRQYIDAQSPEWVLRHVLEATRYAKKEINPTLGRRVLRGVTRADWTDLVLAKRKTAPGAATMLAKLISSFMNDAEVAGWIDHNPLPRRWLTLIAPARAARSRVLRDDELRAVWHAAERLTPRDRAAVRLLMLTGTRRSEVAGLTEAELNLDGGRWMLPAGRTKNRRSYTVPLSALAAAEARTLAAAPTRTTNFTHCKRQLDKASGVTGWVLHDLRRSVRTGLSKLGVRREVAEACVNHFGAKSGLVGVYEHHGYEDEIVAALTLWQNHVAALLAAPPPAEDAGAEIIALRRA